jgi:uncharacterized FlgJ-related protein
MKKLVMTIALIATLASCNSQPTVMTISNDSITVKDVELAVYSLPFKFRRIVVAQAVLETGWFQSKNFKTNNNLFGMRVPYNRMTTADSSINGYAHYKKWEESIIDYYLMLSVRNDVIKMNTETEYYRYLDYIYSEMGHSYSSQLKDIVVRLKLDDLDNNGNYHTKLPIRKAVAKPKHKKEHSKYTLKHL